MRLKMKLFMILTALALTACGDKGINDTAPVDGVSDVDTSPADTGSAAGE